MAMFNSYVIVYQRVHSVHTFRCELEGARVWTNSRLARAARGLPGLWPCHVILKKNHVAVFLFIRCFSMVFLWFSSHFWEEPIHIQDVEPVKVIFAPPKRSTPWFSAGLGALKKQAAEVQRPAETSAQEDRREELHNSGGEKMMMSDGRLMKKWWVPVNHPRSITCSSWLSPCSVIVPYFYICSLLKLP